MHHVFDETPNDAANAPVTIASVDKSHGSALYETHVGLINAHPDSEEQQTDLSQYR